MEFQIAYPSQLLLCLLQRTMFMTGVVTRVSSPNGMVSIPLEAPPSRQGDGENKTFHYGKRIPSAIPKLRRSSACVNRHPDRPVSPPFSSLMLALLAPPPDGGKEMPFLPPLLFPGQAPLTRPVASPFDFSNP